MFLGRRKKKTKETEKVWCEENATISEIMKLLCIPEGISMLGVGVVIVDDTMSELAVAILILSF